MNNRNGEKFSIAILVCLLIISSFVPLVANGANDYAEQESIILSVVGQYKEIIDVNGKDIIAYVNGKEIFACELFRREANEKINNNLQLMYLKKSLQRDAINGEEYNLLLQRFESEVRANSQDDIKWMLIKEELLYQEALRRGFFVSFEEAYQFELSIDEAMRSAPNEGNLALMNYTETIAKGFEMTYDQYQREFIVPVRQRKLATNLFIEAYLKESGVSSKQLTQVNCFMDVMYERLLSEAQIIIVQKEESK